MLENALDYKGLSYYDNKIKTHVEGEISTETTRATNAEGKLNTSINNIVNGVSTVAKATSSTSATYASTSTKAGTSTYATNSGTSTYSTNGAKATSATSATYASTATKAGTATYASNAGTATYAKTAPTATAGTNNTEIANTAFVQTTIANLVDSAPETLNTLNELSAALGDDPNFATTVANRIGNTESNIAKIIDGTTTVGKALKDADGNVITETYATKEEIENISTSSSGDVASTATGTNPTIQDSTNAPFIYGKFKGYTEQDGEPTPDNPVEINGLAKGGAIEVKTCGKNEFNATAETATINGVTFTSDGKGIYTVNGTSVSNNAYIVAGKFTFKANTTYKVIGSPSGSNNAINHTVMLHYGTSYRPTGENGTNLTFKEDTTAEVLVWIRIGMTVNNLVFKPMITTDLTATYDDFEPYCGSTAAIPTDAPLYEGDYLEVYADGSGKLVRAMAKVVFDGSGEWEYWTNNSTANYFYTTLASLGCMDAATNNSRTCAYSSHFKGAEKDNLAGSFEAIAASDNYGVGNFLFINTKVATTVAEWKTWLQSNSVTVVYELAEPTETPLTTEQVAQFKQLYTFEPVTNVLCDGEVEMRYYKANVNGETVGMLQGMVEKNEIEIDDIVNGTITVGKATTATKAGTATYATNSGTSTYSSNSAKATSATSATYASTSTKAGTATYATSAGSASKATSATSATYATTSIKAGTANSASTATVDSGGLNINQNYIKNATVSGKVVTFTKGNGSTFSITTQDTNTDTKVTQTATTASANYPLLLAPSGTTATTTTIAYFDSGVTLNPNTNTIAANISGTAGTATYATSAGSASKATSATYATTATSAGSASKATSATSATYASTSTKAGTATYSTNSGTATYSSNSAKATSATSATYASTANYAKSAPTYKGATTSASATAGLVPAATTATRTSFLRGDGTWATPTNTQNTAGASNTSSKIFLVGATTQSANPQTYTHDTAYVGTDGCVYSNSKKTLTTNSVLSTVAQCEASTTSTDIAGASALAELKNKTIYKAVNVELSENTTLYSIITQNGITPAELSGHMTIEMVLKLTTKTKTFENAVLYSCINGAISMSTPFTLASTQNFTPTTVITMSLVNYAQWYSGQLLLRTSTQPWGGIPSGISITSIRIL